MGFELSPVLWKKIKPSLSAGRVQSVAVRLIVEREREIMDFKAAAYYRVLADFTVTDADGKKSAFRAELSKRYATEQEALALLESARPPSLPYGTSSASRRKNLRPRRSPRPRCSREAGRKLGMSVSQTMSVAQRLYEAGYITYMRTDSVNLSGQAIAAAKAEIVETFR